jgi:hypothetical protein
VGQMFMYDDITAGLIPGNAQAVAGYVDGSFANVSAMQHLFPKARLLTIAVFPQDDAEALDVETGDATNAQVYGWFLRQRARGVYRPAVYTEASNAAALQATMAANGFARSSYRMWTAHYTGTPHFCSPSTCGFGRDQADATQFTSTALGRSLDESLIAADFFTLPPRYAANPVANLTLDVRYTQVDVSWHGAKGAAFYRVNVWYGVNPLTRQLVHRIDTTATKLTVHPLSEGHTYQVTVMAMPASVAGSLTRARRTFTMKKA